MQMNLDNHVKREYKGFSDKFAGGDDLYYITIKVSHIVGRNKISCFKQLSIKIEISNTEISMQTSL